MVLVGVRLGLFSRGQSDSELIKAALDDATTAAMAGRPGPVLEFISKQFTYNGVGDINEGQIANYIKASKPEVVVKNQNAVISGDSATITSTVHVNAPLPGGNSIERDFPNVTLNFRREDTVTWLIFPGKTWRLTEVSAPGAPSADSGE
jgi:hypothetical protein